MSTVKRAPGAVIVPEAFALDRFVQAQDPVMQQVRHELSQARKRTHWMWFVFPQLEGLGHSSMARRYAIGGIAEARAYLKHPILGPRLIECSELVRTVQAGGIGQIFAQPDDLKFHSCMTLFSQLAATAPVFQANLERYFDGLPDALTLRLLANPSGSS
jgi:uncharacterized protein (DUF1810 family)